MYHTHMQIDTDTGGHPVERLMVCALDRSSVVVFNSCSVLEAGCPSSHDPALESRRIPRECWSSVCIGILKNRVLTPVRECLSRVDDPAS